MDKHTAPGRSHQWTRLLPAGAAALLALSPFVTWINLELGGDLSGRAGNLNLFDMATWSGRHQIWGAIPILLAAFAAHAVLRPNLSPAQLILSGALSALVTVLLYATLDYSINEFFAGADPQIRFGPVVALAGSSMLIARGLLTRRRNLPFRRRSRP
jgi:hypothetical protein